MANGKAVSQKTTADILLKLQKDQKKMFGNMRQSGSSSAQADISPSGSGGVTIPSGAYLPIGGGSLTGPLGFTHQVAAIVASVLDISNPAVNTTFVVINDGGPNLQGISAVTPVDAFLILTNGTGVDLTLKQAVAVGMNIDTITHSDVVFKSTDTIALIYNHNPGIWHQITAGGTAISSTGANTSLSNLTNPTSINQNLLPGSDELYNIGSDSLRFQELNVAVIGNVNNLIFGPQASGTRWIEHSGGLIYNVLTGEAHSFQINFSESLDVRAGNVNVTGLFTVSGQSNLNGVVNLGNITSNNINFNGSVNTDIIPNADSTKNIGSSSFRFIVNGSKYLGLRKASSVPSVLDIPNGYFIVMKNTGAGIGSGVNLWYNDGGNLLSVALS